MAGFFPLIIRPVGEGQKEAIRISRTLGSDLVSDYLEQKSREKPHYMLFGRCRLTNRQYLKDNMMPRGSLVPDPWRLGREPKSK